MPENPHVRVQDVSPEPVTEEEGWHKMDIRFLATRDRLGSENATMFRALLPPGAAHKKHRHLHADEIYYIIRGRAAGGVGEREHEIGPGSCVFIPKGVTHWTRNLSPKETLEAVGIYTEVGSLEDSGYIYDGEVTEKDKQIS
ncbi:MAG: cupin domain-containing protein [Nitrospinota bacterium]